MTNTTSLSPLTDSSVLDAVQAAIEKIDLSVLKLPEKNANIEGIDAPGDGVFLTKDGGFQAVVTVYVNLNDKTGVSSAQSLPAIVFGHFDKHLPVVDSANIIKGVAEGLV